MEGDCVGGRGGSGGGLGCEVDDDRLLPASDHYGFTGLIGQSIEFLVRNVRRDINEISRRGFTTEFEMVAPPHTGAAANDVEHGLEFSMMMRAGLGAGLDHNCTGPKFAGARTGQRDGGGTG